MCELLGFSAGKKQNILEYLELFFAHSVRHPHGWGMMYEQNTERMHLKEPCQACTSKMLRHRLSDFPEQHVAIAHIRFATVGSVRTENCHPYYGTDSSGRMWTLVHNGTIYSGRNLTKYLEKQHGDTDSERIFLYLLEEMNRAISVSGRGLTDAERFRIVEQTVISLASRNKLNLLIYDGDLLYVHKNMKGTLHYLQKPDSILFATEKLTTEDNWQSYPLAKLCAFRDGHSVLEGTEHGNIFVPNLESITKAAAMHI
ncbi:MAG: class II glutamine amidotransferase [Oscillospiraceae bacterium]|nr:class II glutamine amidotransferase [Oscillospiraceae bacterium]